MPSEIERLILDELRILQTKVDRLAECQAALKVKTGIFGIIGGLLPALGMALWMLLK